MKNRLNHTVAAATLAAGMMLPFTMAQATNGLLPLGNGMTAHGLGGAGIANPADAMSAVDNPALLGQTGGQISLGASLFNPNRSADIGGGAGYIESDSKYFVIPQFGWTGIINDKFNWGVMVTALGGMNTDYPKELFGQPAEMDLSGVIVAPTFSFKSGEDTYVGLSILLGYEALNSTLPPTDNPAQGAPFATNEDTATGTGIKL
ncbi:MAG: OmpP1/FadL family transporter, partial [Thiohalomonadales bacterium]